MNKKINRNISKAIKPVKLPTIEDQTMRAFMTDLLERAQIPILKDFAKEFGYEDSQVINYFLKHQRNFPRKKISDAIDVLVTKYNANKSFLLTGHGTMYKGAPYMSMDSIAPLPDQSNIMSVGHMATFRKLEEKNKELQEQIKELKKLAASQEATIEIQKKYINKLEK